MFIVLAGSRQFTSYETFMRGMAVALQHVPENERKVIVLSLGPMNINSYGMQFCNLTENYLRQKNIKIMFRMVDKRYLRGVEGKLGYFAYFCAQQEKLPQALEFVSSRSNETGIFKA